MPCVAAWKDCYKPVDGFLNLYKPSSWTSHDCVAKVRRILRQKKVGHGGTLDPMATGVLPIALGRATRLIQYLPGDKAYAATVRFGVTTTTDDIEGEILTERSTATLTRDAAIAAIPQFIGTIDQIPPKYSAIQVEGKRLYDLARSGIEVDVPVRTVKVMAIAIGAWRDGDRPELDLTITCGAGTYIRAIARDLGEAIGTGATLAQLERIRSSGLDLASSFSLEELAMQAESASFCPISPNLALAGLPMITIAGEIALRWRLGQAVTIDPAVLEVWRDQNRGGVQKEQTTDLDLTELTDLAAPANLIESSHALVRVCDPIGEFLGIGRFSLSEARLSPKMVYLPA